MSEGSLSTSRPATREPWTKPWPRPAPRTGRPPPQAGPKTFDLISKFPNEILIIIGDNARVKDLARFTRVSHRFHGLTQDCLWRKAEHKLFWYPMFVGAADGNIPLMEEALRRGCPVSKKWLCFELGKKYGFKNSQTPLHLAVKNGHADAVDWLLERGARTDTRYPDRLKEDMSLLLLALDNAWWKTKACLGMSEERVETLAREWQVPIGPRYRIFSALLQAGAKLPRTRPGHEGHYLNMAAGSCRIVSAPTLQLLLQHGLGGNIHHFCNCGFLPLLPQLGIPPRGEEDERYADYWFWRSSRCLGECTHAGDLVPFSESDRERIWANMCDTLKTVDREGCRLFCPDDEVMQQPYE